MRKLNQVIAIEKGTKSRVYSEFSEKYKHLKKPDLFNGVSQTYRTKDADGEHYPPQKKVAQISVPETLKRTEKILTELFDLTASKDYANCHAKADVVVDGEVILKDAPTTYLLFLEKQLKDLKDFVSHLPVLDSSYEWTYDENAGLYKTEPMTSHRTEKVPTPIVKYDATENHPAQTEMYMKDVVVGYWDKVLNSGAIPAPRRQELADRVEKLTNAVKEARETANSADAPPMNVGSPFFKYLFS